MHLISGGSEKDSFGSFALEMMTSYLHLMAVATNAASEDVQPRFITDVTPGREGREFIQFAAEVSSNAIPIETRLVDSEAALSLHEALHSQEDSTRDRFVRALQQYVFALRYWTPTTRAMAVVHAFMAAEALVDVAKRSLDLDDGVLAERHKKEGGVKWLRRANDVRNAAGAYARRQVIFHGDARTHNAAKEISDGFEHGYGDYGKLRKLAEIHSAAIMAHVRSAIIQLSNLHERYAATLLNEKFSQPVVRFRSVRAEGRLTGQVPGSFPAVPLDLEQSRVGAVSYDPVSGAYTVSVDPQIAVKTDGVVVDRVAVWR